MTSLERDKLEVGMEVIQDEVGEWSERNFGDQPSWRPLLGIGEELGELNHAYLKLSQGIRGDREELENKLVDAVGDLMIYLADFCYKEGIYMGRCMIDAWKEVSQRDWKKYPKNGRTE